MFYMIDIPTCIKSALYNSLRIVLCFCVLGILIFILQGKPLEEIFNIIYESIIEGTIRLFAVFFILITVLRMYSKYVYWKKNFQKGCNVIELHKKWEAQNRQILILFGSKARKQGISRFSHIKVLREKNEAPKIQYNFETFVNVHMLNFESKLKTQLDFSYPRLKTLTEWRILFG